MSLKMKRRDLEDAPFVGDPWSRQLTWHEGAKSFECFTIFRDMDPVNRTIRAAGDEYRTRNNLRIYPRSKSDPMVEGWSSIYRWRERVEAFDAYMDAKEVETMRRRRMAAARRHADQAAESQAALLHPIKKYNSRVNAIAQRLADDGLDDLTDEELVRLVRHTASILPDMQRAEREGLNIAADAQPSDPGRISVRGEVLRRVLQSPDAIGLLESINFRVTEELSPGDDPARSA